MMARSREVNNGARGLKARGRIRRLVFVELEMD